MPYCIPLQLLQLQCLLPLVMSCYDNRYIKTPNLDENVGRVLDYLEKNGLKAELVSLQQKYNDPIESVLTEKSR
jgi:hypothetical protein